MRHFPAAVLMMACVIAGRSAEARGRPWLSSLDGNSVVSPIGITSSLCGLLPAMSARARAEIEASFPSTCESEPSYVETATWIPLEIALSTPVASALRKAGEIHRGAAPVNADIAGWIEAHHGLPAPNQGPVRFASVSVLDYSAQWIFPRTAPVRPKPFYGLRETRIVPFVLNLRSASVDRFSECDRVTIRLYDGGLLFLTRMRPGTPVARCFEEPLRDVTSRTAAAVAVPEVTVRNEVRLRDALELYGVRSIFNESTNPFPGLQAGLALTALNQVVQLRLDRFGVGVKATTVADYALSGGGLVPNHIIFDSPFAMRIEDAHRNIVADATVDDV